MFHRMIFVMAIAIIFLSGCDSKQQVDKVENHKEQDKESANNSGIVTLNKDAIETAGIKTEVVSLRPLRIEYTFSGKVDVNETRLAHVSSRIPGRAVEVYANPGDHVRKGEPLAIIDSPEIGEAQGQYLKAKTALQVAEKSYERAKIILKEKVISTGEFQRREGEYLSSITEAKVAEDWLHLLGMTDEEISSIEKVHTINSKVAIYSPIAGSVIERHLTLGEVVEPVKPLFVIANLLNIWVIADIPENDSPRIKKGQSVAVTATPYPEKIFRGQISYISNTIDPATRTVQVRIEVENTKGELKPEMFASIKISTDEKEKVLAIPVSAVQREGEKTVVFVAKDENSFEKRGVELGLQAEGFHQVISGIKKGERIVTKGAFTLKSETMKGLMEEE